MGEFLAWVIGWDLVLEYAVGAATVSISWSAYVTSVLHDFGISLPPYLIASPWQPVQLPNGQLVHGLINLPAVFIICVVSTLLMIGIKESANVNAVVVVIKVAVVLVFIGVGIWFVKGSNYTPFIPENTGKFGEYGWSGILRAAGVIFFAYIGFDAVSTAAQEAKNPQKDMPIGIIGSLIVCTILYMAFAVVMTGLANYKEFKGMAAPVAVAIAHTPYKWLQPLVKLAIIAGFTSVILVMLLGQSRVFFSMSRDGLLPKDLLRDPSAFQDALALEPAVHGVREPVLGLRADFGGRPHDQHRNAVRLRHRLRRNHHHAEDPSEHPEAVSDTVGPAGPDPGHPGELRPDVRPGLAELGAAVRLAGDRPVRLLRLQPVSQPAAGRGWSGTRKVGPPAPVPFSSGPYRWCKMLS